jgi:hypothetical protein
MEVLVCYNLLDQSVNTKVSQIKLELFRHIGNNAACLYPGCSAFFPLRPSPSCSPPPFYSSDPLAVQFHPLLSHMYSSSPCVSLQLHPYYYFHLHTPATLFSSSTLLFCSAPHKKPLLSCSPPPSSCYSILFNYTLCRTVQLHLCCSVQLNPLLFCSAQPLLFCSDSILAVILNSIPAVLFTNTPMLLCSAPPPDILFSHSPAVLFSCNSCCSV